MINTYKTNIKHKTVNFTELNDFPELSSARIVKVRYIPYSRHHCRNHDKDSSQKKIQIPTQGNENAVVGRSLLEVVVEMQNYFAFDINRGFSVNFNCPQPL